MWKSLSGLKKSKQIKLSSNSNNIYLPNYTNGVKWNNTNCIATVTQLNPQDNVLSCSVERNKKDDNNYNLKFKSSKYNGKTLIKSINTNNFHLENVDLVTFMVEVEFDEDFAPGDEFYDWQEIYINNRLVGRIELYINKKNKENGFYYNGILDKDNVIFLYDQYEEDIYPGDDDWGYVSADSHFLFSYIGYKDKFDVKITEGSFFETYIYNIEYNSRKIENSKFESGVALFYEQD